MSFKEAEKKEVKVALEVDPNAAKAAATPADTAPRETKHTDPAPVTVNGTPATRTLGWIALGVGVVGLGAGAVTGGIFLKHNSDLQTDCPDKQCTEAHRSDLDATKTWGTITTVALAVGAVGVTTGVVLLLTSEKSSSSARAVVSPSWAGVEGRF